ncbi:MAG: diguanylate cyclase [Actinomycetota bacterium]|nr:diguanylate cyclase [Actinomycetota bacterium]
MEAELPRGSTPEIGRDGENRVEPRELLSGRTAAGPLAQVQALLALGAAINGAIATLLPHPSYFNEPALLGVQVVALSYGFFVLLRRDTISLLTLRIGNLFAAVLTTVAVYYSGDATSGYAIFYLWIGFYVFYYPISRTEAALNLAFAAACYAVAIVITPEPPADQANAQIAFFSIIAGTLATAGLLLTYLRQRVERLMSRLVEASRTDPLTELPNRMGLQRSLEREFERARPDQRPLSLLVLDVDRFKAINSQFGIGAGDRVLREIGALLVRSFRLIDTVARSGGEEFAILLPETDQHGAFLLAEKVLSRLRGSNLAPGHELTASAGVATFPTHGDDPARLIAAADRALYAAKALGRDRTVIYSPEVTSIVGAVAGRRNVESQAQLATVLSLAEALDQRDTGTAKHSQTVGLLCQMMARELGLEDARVQRIRLGGILHDIGKIGVPDAILRKPGPLTDEEREQMRGHPELGAKILSGSELDDIRGWVLAHHERPDGKGYPAGLTAEKIPLEAAILAVGDAYEAMTADRVYRLAIGPKSAREELRDNAGTQFDSRVVEALLRALEREPAELKL